MRTLALSVGAAALLMSAAPALAQNSNKDAPATVKVQPKQGGAKVRAGVLKSSTPSSRSNTAGVLVGVNAQPKDGGVLGANAKGNVLKTKQGGERSSALGPRGNAKANPSNKSQPVKVRTGGVPPSGN